jgi:hypothetical protein
MSAFQDARRGTLSLRRRLSYSNIGHADEKAGLQISEVNHA